MLNNCCSYFSGCHLQWSEITVQVPSSDINTSFIFHYWQIIFASNVFFGYLFFFFLFMSVCLLHTIQCTIFGLPLYASWQVQRSHVTIIIIKIVSQSKGTPSCYYLATKPPLHQLLRKSNLSALRIVAPP